MSDNFSLLQLAIFAAGLVALLAIFGYSAYWAFSIRRALAVRVYRNQALGMGLVALARARAPH